VNERSYKKYMVLIRVSVRAFVGDFGMTAGIPAVVLQSRERGLSAADVNYPKGVVVMIIGAGSLIWMSLTNFWGCAPVFVWTMPMGLMFTLACLLTRDCDTYHDIRALQVLLQATSSTIGLVIIHDLLFSHEHPRKVGVAGVAFIYDCFPERLGEVSALINFGRAPFGFVVGVLPGRLGSKAKF
jgi:hypothetical protein